MRSLVVVSALVVVGVLVVGSSLPVAASHQVSACGRLIELSPPPGNDPTSGLGRIRLATASGEVTFLFHSYDPSGRPSSADPGADRLGATVCFSGTHVESASPARSDYVSAYRLTVTPASLPGTSTHRDPP